MNITKVAKIIIDEVNIELKTIISRIGVSETKLKDLVLESNKIDVVEFALDIMADEKQYSMIKEKINPDINYICPINDRQYIESKYDELKLLSKRDYPSNKTRTNMVTYSIDKGSIDKGIPIADFTIFAELKCIAIYETLNKFLFFPKGFMLKETESTQFMLNCRLTNDFLKERNFRIVTLCLMQIILVDEMKKNNKEDSL